MGQPLKKKKPIQKGKQIKPIRLADITDYDVKSPKLVNPIISPHAKLLQKIALKQGDYCQ